MRRETSDSIQPSPRSPTIARATAPRRPCFTIHGRRLISQKCAPRPGCWHAYESRRPRNVSRMRDRITAGLETPSPSSKYTRSVTRSAPLSAAERAARSSKELALDLISKKSLTSTTALLVYLGLADFVVHMAFAGNYGYFPRRALLHRERDPAPLSRLRRLPPAHAWVAALLYPLTADSLVSIRAVSALSGGLVVLVAGMIARELGGGRRAQVLDRRLHHFGAHPPRRRV